MKNSRIICGLLILVMCALSVPFSGCSRQGASSHAASPAVARLRYHCPMHPQIVQDHPGECPICGMALELIGESGASVVSTGITGLAAVTIPAATRQLMGLKVGLVERHAMTRHLRVPARIAADETRQTRVTTKLEGFVEKLREQAGEGCHLWGVLNVNKARPHAAQHALRTAALAATCGACSTSTRLAHALRAALPV